MIVNCGFELKISKNHYGFKNKQNIVITCDKNNIPEIRKQLMKHKPDGRNWFITGFSLIKE